MKNHSYIKILFFHILLGIVIYYFKGLSKLYLLSIVIYFTSEILRAKPSQKPLKILIACGYISGSEVLLRMTGGNLFYETSKYLIILYSLIGIFTKRQGNLPLSYFIYILLLIPGIFISAFNSYDQSSFRTDVAFNLSGPVCLGIVSIFCYKLKVTYMVLQRVFVHIALPLISTLTYVIVFSPDVKEIATGTSSNFAASGGFGPNQVSTVLGLGIFIFLVRFFMRSPTLFFKLMNGALLAIFSFRSIVTFSRGGVLTALFMIITFVYFYYRKVNSKARVRIGRITLFVFCLGVSIWFVSSIQTNGLIDNRYTNRDASGKYKTDATTGRGDLISYELQEFFNNPVFGIGVGGSKLKRFSETGIMVASHNEMSRIISEHGIFGVFAFLILLLSPLILRFRNKSNIFFYSFYLFWFFTINHSSMRIAAPAFIYGLCLLDIKYKKKTPTKNKTIKLTNQHRLLVH